ncbi:hypothetical protein V1478_008314 [Vespula squamosa]|uniref:Secreted protein n=1 Tax=Vespula squamosa TaxID=30214 RepID=A0ABD2AYG3_VESSQ
MCERRLRECLLVLLLLLQATASSCYFKLFLQQAKTTTWTGFVSFAQGETKRGMPRRTRARQFEISKQDVSDREAFEWRHQQWRLLALAEPTSS